MTIRYYREELHTLPSGGPLAAGAASRVKLRETWVDGAGRRRIVETVSPSSSLPVSTPLVNTELPADDYVAWARGLPLQPADLEAALLKRAPAKPGASESDRIFRQASLLLCSHVPDADLCASLYRLLQRTDGILESREQDQEQQHDVVFSVESNHSSWQMRYELFVEADGGFLGYREVRLDQVVEGVVMDDRPAVVSSAKVLQVAEVSAVGARP